MKNKNLIKIAKTCIPLLLFITVITGCLKSEEKQRSSLSIINGEIIFNGEDISEYGKVNVIGVIVENRTSLVLYWIKENNSVAIKKAYTPSPDVLPIYQEILALNLTSPYTGSMIIPYSLRYNNSEKCWHFNYYDWEPTLGLGEGDAFYYPVNQTVLWLAHSR